MTPFPLLSLLTAAVLSGAAPAPPPGNLLVNGDVEAGASSWRTTTGAPAVLSYSTGNGYPTAADPGPAERGERFFGGGDQARTQIVQEVGLPRANCFEFSGWLGGYATQQDGARLTLEFLDAQRNPTGLVTLGPVTAQDRRNITGLFERTAKGTVPVGSATARVSLLFTRADGGTSNDGYADNIELRLRKGSC